MEMDESGATEVRAALGAPQESILEALPGDRILQSNALATVTTNCLIIIRSDDHSQTIIPIAHLAGIGTAKTTYPGLLVVSAACFLIAAGAYCSKQEGQAAIPAALLGLLFLFAYVAHRRVAVSFTTQSDKTITQEGSTREAAALIKAIRSVQAAKAERAGYESGP
jgi:hypothetical protein